MEQSWIKITSHLNWPPSPAHDMQAYGSLLFSRFARDDLKDVENYIFSYVMFNLKNYNA